MFLENYCVYYWMFLYYCQFLFEKYQPTKLPKNENYF